jgi:hypothetical protein
VALCTSSPAHRSISRSIACSLRSTPWHRPEGPHRKESEVRARSNSPGCPRPPRPTLDRVRGHQVVSTSPDDRPIFIGRGWARPAHAALLTVPHHPPGMPLSSATSRQHPGCFPGGAALPPEPSALQSRRGGRTRRRRIPGTGPAAAAGIKSLDQSKAATMGQLEVRVLVADTEDLRGGSMLEWDVHGESATGRRRRWPRARSWCRLTSPW